MRKTTAAYSCAERMLCASRWIGEPTFVFTCAYRSNPFVLRYFIRRFYYKVWYFESWIPRSLFANLDRQQLSGKRSVPSSSVWKCPNTSETVENCFVQVLSDGTLGHLAPGGFQFRTKHGDKRLIGWKTRFVLKTSIVKFAFWHWKSIDGSPFGDTKVCL